MTATKLNHPPDSKEKLAASLQMIANRLESLDINNMDFKSSLVLEECKRICYQALNKSKEETPITNNKAKGIVLIVDDDPIVQKMLKFVLSKAGYTIHSELNPENAIEKVTDLKPDVVLLDLMMPQMTGFEFLSRIKGKYDPSFTKIIVGSARSYDSDKTASLKSGANDFIAKPYNVQEIVARINSYSGDKSGK